MNIMLRKAVSLLICVMMIAAVFTVAADASIKESNAAGTIVYLPYSSAAPNMDEGSIDDTWGEMLIHIDKNTKNAGMWAHMLNSTTRCKPEDSEVDMYASFDDKNMYFAFWTPDDSILGGVVPWHGDALVLMMEIGNPHLTYICPEDPDRPGEATSLGYGLILGGDDYTADPAGDGIVKPSMVEKRGGYYIKFGVPFKAFGLKDKDLEDGILINFNLMRTSATTLESDGYDGWLYWGKVFDQSLGVAPYYVADSPNAKGPNTFYIKKSNTKGHIADTLLTDAEYTEIMGGASEPEPEQPAVTPAAPAEKPSSWAAEEVDAAIKEGLVPADLQKDYTKGISRENLSKMLGVLIDKVYGKAPAKSDAKFTDTTDAAVLKAANLGIINGYRQADGSYAFKPANTLKRSEMSAIINRVAKLCGKTTTGYDKEVKFTDTALHWCKGELGYPVHMGIVKGTSATTFSPENTLTTEQTIMMIYRTFMALK